MLLGKFVDPRNSSLVVPEDVAIGPAKRAEVESGGMPSLDPLQRELQLAWSD